MSPPFDIDLFHGQVSVNSAQIYARVDQLPGGEDWALTGRIRGPICRHAKTLPSTYSFVDLGKGKSVLARASLPDPCFWSPELPAQYQVSLQLLQNSTVIQTYEHDYGIRFFGVRGRSFYFADQRWVVRGAAPVSDEAVQLSEWRDASAALLVKEPSEELCREAAREGVFVVAAMRDIRLPVLRRVAKWASVGLIVDLQESAQSTEAASHFPNAVLAHVAANGQLDLTTPPYSVLIVEEGMLREAPHIPGKRAVPIVALRRYEQSLPLAAAREACDDLQRDLAPYGDFAGYLIG